MAYELTTPLDCGLTAETAPADVVLAATAHELRLPVSHIKGFVSSLRRTDVSWDSETRSEFLEEIELEADRLEDLIDSMLADTEAAHRCSNSKDCQPTPPAQIIRSALHRVRSVLGDHPIHVDVPDWLPACCIDRDGIERVVANLVENAVKYSPPRSPIEISGHQVGGTLEIMVADRGSGVRAEDRQRIFWPFYRSKSAVGGHGLGLAIALSIVRAHGGQIVVNDRAGGGASFSVRIPSRDQAA